jgi:hypothetical protein
MKVKIVINALKENMNSVYKLKLKNGFSACGGECLKSGIHSHLN